MNKQICTFPYAPHSSPTFNRHAYVTARDGKNWSIYFTVWSPVHYPHLVGRYATKEQAQKRADKINGMGALIYGLR